MPATQHILTLEALVGALETDLACMSAHDCVARLEVIRQTAARAFALANEEREPVIEALVLRACRLQDSDDQLNPAPDTTAPQKICTA